MLESKINDMIQKTANELMEMFNNILTIYPENDSLRFVKNFIMDYIVKQLWEACFDMIILRRF